MFCGLLFRTSRLLSHFLLFNKVRTLPYPFLHLVHYELNSDSRIQWDVLVSLNDRKPSGLENMGDCAGIALRVAELYDAANAWQAEITKVTMLSFRGGKRRGEGSGVESEGGTQSRVDVEKVQRLASDPVLKKVRRCVREGCGRFELMCP